MIFLSLDPPLCRIKSSNNLTQCNADMYNLSNRFQAQGPNQLSSSLINMNSTQYIHMLRNRFM
ncbi:hypothetical protein Ciccas_013494 [Cichlidogyrus casuarinus]|uniref:Uncharacterized protein n=1 Tax=Cichlidogyrus casuarinus TaxID=1844966 RepID=A0ABD2PKF1_9PLAT